MKLCFLPKPKTFGSARWAKRKEFKSTLKGQGLILGKIGRKFLRYNDKEGSTIIFAPTRSGKGVGFVIPNLLDYRGSVLCTDPKGENYRITKRHRKTYGDVFCLNISDPTDSAHYNPMDSIRTGDFHETDDAVMLAGLMIVPEKHSPAHWRNKATEWLAGFILYVAHKYPDTPELRTLTEVRNITKSEADTFALLLEDMQESLIAIVRETATEILAMDNNPECNGILSTLEKGTRPFGEGRAAAIISSKSDFSFNDFNSKIKTVYIVVPPENLEQYSSYMRVITGLAISGLQREGKTSEFPPLLMLDEVAALGYLEPLESGIAYLSSYARLVLVFQDVSQLKNIYPKADSIISNTNCQIYFSVNEIGTAQGISNRIGHKTIKSRSQGQSQAHDAILTHQQQAGTAEAARLLIDPSEVTRLKIDEVIIFMKKECIYPIFAKTFKYYEHASFKGKFDKWRG
ncbi:MAG: type IV secretory system conjugative DNA transfer family protein [Rhizobiales bacterium]|nr:type IV secretory system conjugative DNA transfer family protein [Hyphomicrobiales bacterium]